MRQPVVMMSNTGTTWEIVGEKVRADSWWGSTDGIHTVSIDVRNFIGGVQLQGTLSLDPDESDWFPIHLCGNCDQTGILKFPLVSTAPTSNNGGDSGIFAFTFVGNMTFLRANLVRTYLETPANTDLAVFEANVGSVNKILLSL